MLHQSGTRSVCATALRAAFQLLQFSREPQGFRHVSSMFRIADSYLQSCTVSLGIFEFEGTQTMKSLAGGLLLLGGDVLETQLGNDFLFPVFQAVKQSHDR